MLRRITEDIKNLKKTCEELYIDDNNVIYFILNGPKDTCYENGKWKVRIEMSKEYPYKSPSVGFVTPIYHPNVDQKSGSICLNVLNQTWTPIYNLSHIKETFLPQLLTYPNPDDPLNTEAASIYNNNNEEFINIVKYYIDKHCNSISLKK
jgi:ubiquitin-conjugating enzyme E2 H|uniref:UBC core domain-containing protein n=1 Tax=viral metagenome TaxID=1070528 RepID=A0A6C0LXW9_9ZZZZ